MKVVVLGSTGSIGTSSLDVIRNLDDIELVGIAANRNIQGLLAQLEEFRPPEAVIADTGVFESVKDELSEYSSTNIRPGSGAIIDLVTDSRVDVVINGLSGIAGLSPTIAALKAGKTVASANKESIVMGWHLIKDSVTAEEQLIPVDSEHSAVLQGLKGEITEYAKRIILTASGGAVYRSSLEDLETVTAARCLDHPTWNMGSKITIDCATLMNKGLEVIEARNLFDMDYSRIDVLVHPQSIVHGMVEYIDGTMIACMAAQDMKIPIQYALTHPARKKCPSRMLDIKDICRLEFEIPDRDKFPCLDLAVEAGKRGGSAPVVLCAADDTAVEAFLNDEIGFMDIPRIIRGMLDSGLDGPVDSPGDIEELYSRVMERSREMIKRRSI